MIFSHWKLKLLKIRWRNLWAPLVIVSLTFTAGIDSLKEEVCFFSQGEQLAAKWLSLNTSYKLASPWLQWELVVVGGVGRRLQYWSTQHNCLLQGLTWISRTIEAHFRNWLPLCLFVCWFNLWKTMPETSLTC